MTKEEVKSILGEPDNIHRMEYTTIWYYKRILNHYGTMVLIPGGIFLMGSDNEDAYENESPVQKVKVNSFLMDINEVTNKEFLNFINETGYKTTAERPIDWELIKHMFPDGTKNK